LHMMPNTLAWQNSSVKATNRMYDRSEEPNDLILLALADSFGMTHDRPYYESEAYLFERLGIFKELMSRPYVTGGDLVKAGLKPGPVMGEALAYAHKLRLAGTEKENALKQTLRYADQLIRKHG
ncbi:MAG: tRNA nucleotidyltransferase, partial [Clostridia bacterium]|nr:tRNA nucleotidyltransferase [Clostridia bacterium]